MSIITINPATGNVLATYEAMSTSTVASIIAALKTSHQAWKQQDYSFRATKLLKVADLLRKRKQYYASCITTEMGKPISAARSEIEKCALVCEYYAQNSEKLLETKAVKSSYVSSEVMYQPLGIIFAIMPWNFPFWQVFRFAAPNLMAGNSVLLSHAPIVTGCALEIEKLFIEADIADFRTVLVSHENAAVVISHPDVAGVTLTGSEAAGKAVASHAGAHLKKVVLELGGADPYLILEDANLSFAADAIVKSRMNNAGQVCIAAKRIIAASTIYNELLSLILEKLKTYKIGDPLSEDTMMGPLARHDLREKVHEQVLSSIKKGAQLMLGGEIPAVPGFFYPPTILSNVSPGMPAFDDEIFGPVISLVHAENDEDALRLANQSRFGLSAAVFTNDKEKAYQIAKKLEVGTCCINGIVSSDPRLPFGGIKASGYGRELSEEGLREFLNIKTITVAL